MKKIRVLLIENRPEFIAAINRSIEQTRDIECIGDATDFPSGLILIKNSKPDIILAYDDPKIGDFTAELLRIFPDIGIIIVSGDDPASPQNIVIALAKGAFDFVPGMVTKTIMNGNEVVSNLLLSKIRCCSIKRYSRMVKGNGSEDALPRNNQAIQKAAEDNLCKSAQKKSQCLKFDAVLIGVSTGGPEALMKLLPALPEKFPVPILIVLHMPKEFTEPMAAALDRKSRVRVHEVRDGDDVLPGKAYLAHGGLHCTVTRTVSGGVQLHTNDDPPENGCKPSVDVMFRSAVSVYKSRTLAVVLTGMGNDGMLGCKAVKNQGGFVLVQDEQSSVVWGMPGSVVRAGLADEIVPITAIPERLCDILGVH